MNIKVLTTTGQCDISPIFMMSLNVTLYHTTVVENQMTKTFSTLPLWWFLFKKNLLFVSAGDPGCCRDWGHEEETGSGRDGAEAGAGRPQRTEGGGGADGGRQQAGGGKEGSERWSRRRDRPEPALGEEESQRWWVYPLIVLFVFIEHPAENELSDIIYWQLFKCLQLGLVVRLEWRDHL